MPSQFDKYRFTKKTVLDDETFNRIWLDIDLRLVALEDVKKDWQGAVDVVTRYGLQRIEDVLRPSWEYISQKKDEADSLVEEIEELRESADEMINERRDDAITAVNSAKTTALNVIENKRLEVLGDIEDAGEEIVDAVNIHNQSPQAHLALRFFAFFMGGE